jgi:hypothetical protein
MRIHNVHHVSDVFDLCHGVYAMLFPYRPHPQFPLGMPGTGSCAIYLNQMKALLCTGPFGLARCTIEGWRSTMPSPGGMHAHGVWLVQTWRSGGLWLLMRSRWVRANYMKPGYGNWDTLSGGGSSRARDQPPLPRFTSWNASGIAVVLRESLEGKVEGRCWWGLAAEDAS